jgi:hypothetical protein
MVGLDINDGGVHIANGGAVKSNHAIGIKNN